MSLPKCSRNNIFFCLGGTNISLHENRCWQALVLCYILVCYFSPDLSQRTNYIHCGARAGLTVSTCFLWCNGGEKIMKNNGILWYCLTSKEGERYLKYFLTLNIKISKLYINEKYRLCVPTHLDNNADIRKLLMNVWETQTLRLLLLKNRTQQYSY